VGPPSTIIREPGTTLSPPWRLAPQELKEDCQRLGLPVTGKKAELVDRILEALAAGTGSGAAATAAAAPGPAVAAAAPMAAAAAAEATAAAGGVPAASGKHQRIEFHVEPAAAAPEPEGPKIIKLATDEVRLHAWGAGRGRRWGQRARGPTRPQGPAQRSCCARRR
jgi:hypothetical protein